MRLVPRIRGPSDPRTRDLALLSGADISRAAGQSSLLSIRTWSSDAPAVGSRQPNCFLRQELAAGMI